MFKNFALLAMAFVLLSGCATMQHGIGTNSTLATTFEELEKLPYAFVIVHGKYGKEKMFTSDGSPEQYANLSTILTEPGFIVIINNETRNDGMDTKLEEIFKKEGFNLVGTKVHTISSDESYFQMNFAKNGKIVIFKD